MKLSDLKGETVVLYFYPRADTVINSIESRCRGHWGRPVKTRTFLPERYVFLQALPKILQILFNLLHPNSETTGQSFLVAIRPKGRE